MRFACQACGPRGPGCKQHRNLVHRNSSASIPEGSFRVAYAHTGVGPQPPCPAAAPAGVSTTAARRCRPTHNSREHVAMAVDKAEFRQALGHFAAGVTVVTAAFDGQRGGITVTAFTSLSLDPPLVLICIDKQARMHDRFRVGGHFAVNMLHTSHQELASREFASECRRPVCGDRLSRRRQRRTAAGRGVVLDRVPGGQAVGRGRSHDLRRSGRSHARARGQAAVVFSRRLLPVDLNGV